MKKLGKKGFTLIELMIVIAIIAILAAILVPNFVKARAQGQLTSCKSNLKNIGTACEMFAADHNGRYPVQASDLNVPANANTSAYLQRFPECPLNANNGQGDYSYNFAQNPDYYIVWCTNGNHAQAGIEHNSANNWPKFDSQIGLMAPELGQAQQLYPNVGGGVTLQGGAVLLTNP